MGRRNVFVLNSNFNFEIRNEIINADRNVNKESQYNNSESEEILEYSPNKK